jgi:anhydro-N-acetylmuramic acid kinase
MSGTSTDGLDVALCDVNVCKRYIQNILSQSFPYSDVLRGKLLDVAHVGSANLHELVALSYYLGHFYAECVETFCRVNTLPLASIDLIGSHGQTIAHLSQPRLILGSRYRGTLQIGEAEVIAKRLGIFTVSDFRAADIALGGSGAPLVPIYHQCRFAEPGCLRVIINIGGIANITLLDGTDRITATDTGPGNCLIDGCMQVLYGQPYDAGGQIALSGRIDSDLLGRLRRDETLTRSLPTSFDRKELFELANRHNLLATMGQVNKEDVVATVSELTTITIADAISSTANGAAPDRLLVCGGGVFNNYILSRLKRHFGDQQVVSTAEYGSDPEYVEAEAFAYLANLTVEAEVANIPTVTGASRQSVLGKISQP